MLQRCTFLNRLTIMKQKCCITVRGTSSVCAKVLLAFAFIPHLDEKGSEFVITECALLFIHLLNVSTNMLTSKQEVLKKLKENTTSTTVVNW